MGHVHLGKACIWSEMRRLGQESWISGLFSRKAERGISHPARHFFDQRRTDFIKGGKTSEGNNSQRDTGGRETRPRFPGNPRLGGLSQSRLTMPKNLGKLPGKPRATGMTQRYCNAARPRERRTCRRRPDCHPVIGTGWAKRRALSTTTPADQNSGTGHTETAGQKNAEPPGAVVS